MNEISPAAVAKAVLEAALQSGYGCSIEEAPNVAARMKGPVAAALCAAMEQVLPELGRPRNADERNLYHEGRLDAVIRHRAHFLAIAAELENFQPPR